MEYVILPEDMVKIPQKFATDCIFNKPLYVPATVEVIGQDAFKNSTLTICGYAGTAIETYALENDIEFIDITNHEHNLTDFIFYEDENFIITGKYCEECGYGTECDMKKVNEDEVPEPVVTEKPAEINISYSDFSVKELSKYNTVFSTKILNPENKHIESVGCYLYDESGELIKNYSEKCNIVSSSVTYTCDINNDMSYILTAGTKYKFQIYVTIDGKEYKDIVREFNTVGLPTPEPTASPTPTPTASPTPTPEPTASPTPEPTASPTPEPTASPTPEPTASQTPEPTASPTPEPTASPTPEPTASPTPTPTVSPTPEPTATPLPERLERVGRIVLDEANVWERLLEVISFGIYKAPETKVIIESDLKESDIYYYIDRSGKEVVYTEEELESLEWLEYDEEIILRDGKNVVYAKIEDSETGYVYYLCTNGVVVEQPTASPKPEPTASPTPMPTASPTPAPTVSPTPEPTASPTPTPTASPTPAPTASPTPEPTASPTPEPTASPTPEPTASPIPEPTASPTPAPTASPTPEPTASPTPEPTASPTPEPTATPLPERLEKVGRIVLDEANVWERLLEVISFGIYKAPETKVIIESDLKESDIYYYIDGRGKEVVYTEEELESLEWLEYDEEIILRDGMNVVYAKIEDSETGYVYYLCTDGVVVEQPTASPTPEATASPTPEPTASPTPEPTASPTPEPTASPTPEPTASPTPAPTASPTPEPTSSPTPEPTTSPTPTPTASPTPEPTASPIPEPTATPLPERLEKVGRIVLDEANVWERLLEVISFGIYKAPETKVIIESDLKESDIYYYMDGSGKEVVYTEEELESLEWLEYDEEIILRDGKNVVYAKIEDSETGYVYYLCTDGVVVEQPTAIPTPTPTASPTPDATASPTPELTASPTPTPTASPTPAPTAGPTPEPTSSPTPEPTSSPTPEPTASPTPEPTTSPTPAPTANPMPEPTSSPMLATISFTDKLTISSNDNKTATLKWKGSDEITAQKIYRSTKKNGKYKCIAALDGNASSYVDKTIKPLKTYYYKIEAGINNGYQKQSIYSNIHKIKVTGLSTPAMNVKVEKGKNGVRYIVIKMKKCDGKYFEVYVKQKKKYQKIQLTSNLVKKHDASFKLRYTGNNKKLSFKIRTYNVKNKKKIYSNYSKQATVKIK